MDRWLDDVARGVAGGVSRRQALRRVGLGLAGLLMASVAPTVARAKKKDDGDGSGGDGKGKGKGGNKSCAHFCKDLPPRKRGKCVSDAARKRGLCYDCGPEPKGNGTGLCGEVCCGENETCDPAKNVCTCPNATDAAGNCCAAGQIICDGACVDPLTDNTNCGTCGTICTTPQVCTNGACV